MCYAGNCNPECGTCRPKRLIAVVCPDCGMRNTVSREQFLNRFKLPHKKSIMEEKMLERGMDLEMHCLSCGCDLSELYRESIKPKPCKRMGIVCGFPCGRCNEEGTGTNEHCNTMVPMEKLK